MTPKKAQASTDGHGLIRDVRDIIAQARSLTRRTVNSLQVISNYLVGMRIAKEEQTGLARAEYGKETLRLLSKELSQEFGRGYSHRNLKYMRRFYLTYSPKLEGKLQIGTGISEEKKIGQTVFAQSFSQKTQSESEIISFSQDFRTKNK